jgi:NAD(P)-dependent dehydrogenase (short-subunit alcohol dehydrogenase family)
VKILQEETTVLERFSLNAKVAIVTGASRGIGEAIARCFAEAGAHVVVSSRKPDGCEAVAASIRAKGHRAVAIAAHIGEPDAIRRLVAETVRACGGIDVIVNNAATNPVFGPLLDADVGAFQKIYDVNVRGPLLLCQGAFEHLAARGGGALVHIASIGGISPEPMLGVYSSSKAALISLSKVMALEWGGAGIRSNVICPGLTKTRFAEAIWSDEHMTSETVGHQPIARVATPDEIAGMALFLASPAASYCTGGVYPVDGGHTV